MSEEYTITKRARFRISHSDFTRWLIARVGSAVKRAVNEGAFKWDIGRFLPDPVTTYQEYERAFIEKQVDDNLIRETNGRISPLNIFATYFPGSANKRPWFPKPRYEKHERLPLPVISFEVTISADDWVEVEGTCRHPAFQEFFDQLWSEAVADWGVGNDLLRMLKAKINGLTAQLEYAYGPEHVMLSYERAVVAHQLEREYERQYPRFPHAAKPSTRQTNQEPQAPPPVHVGLWDCDTLIVPKGSSDFRLWLWDKLDFMVQDFAKDWQVSRAQPGHTVLVYKRIADKREREVSPGAWVIDVDVEGVVWYCDRTACDPDMDSGDILVGAKQVLESALSFKIMRTGDSETEVSRYCGTIVLAQQFDAIRNMIMERWPETKRLQTDTDVSFRGSTKQANPTTEQQTPQVPKEINDQGSQQASSLHPMSRQWPPIKTNKESFYRRLREAVERIPHEMRRVDRQDGEFEIMKAEVTPLPESETDQDVLRLGIAVTLYPSLKYESREGPYRRPDLLGYMVVFEMRNRKGGLISVYAFGDPTYNNVFQILAREIDWAIANDDWPESDQATTAPSTSAENNEGEEGEGEPTVLVEQTELQQVDSDIGDAERPQTGAQRKDVYEQAWDQLIADPQAVTALKFTTLPVWRKVKAWLYDQLRKDAGLGKYPSPAEKKALMDKGYQAMRNRWLEFKATDKESPGWNNPRP